MKHRIQSNAQPKSDCPSGKRKFASKHNANMSIARVVARTNSKGYGRSYLCEFCHCWHMTSVPKRHK